jgi:hypothetical protein
MEDGERERERERERENRVPGGKESPISKSSCRPVTVVPSFCWALPPPQGQGLSHWIQLLEVFSLPCPALPCPASTPAHTLHIRVQESWACMHACTGWESRLLPKIPAQNSCPTTAGPFPVLSLFFFFFLGSQVSHG